MCERVCACVSALQQGNAALPVDTALCECVCVFKECCLVLIPLAPAVSNKVTTCFQQNGCAQGSTRVQLGIDSFTFSHAITGTCVETGMEM